MEQKIQEFIISNELLQSEDKILLAVSGGRDSVVLLNILTNLKYHVEVAHCNFGLRGAESEKDQLFVEQLCKRLKVKCHTKQFDAKVAAKEEGVSIQMKARDLRYGWFEELMQERQLNKIATAHHLDDQLETILINLTRGTGIKGLRGMKEKRGNIVRPLMCVERDEINQYLFENQIPFREDSSNASGKYFRNKIRHQIIPSLKEINPSIFKAVSNTTKRLRNVEDKWEEQFSEWKEGIQLSNAREVIPFELVNESSISFVQQYLRSKGFSYPDIERIIKAQESQSGAKFHGRGNLVLITSKQAYELYEENVKDSNIYYLDESLPIELEVMIEENPVDIQPNSSIAYINADKVLGKLNLRKWKEGDWFIPFGMRGKQKLSDFFVNNKFSLADKENTWLLCDSEKVVWIVGHRIDNRYKVDENTKNVYIIKSN